MKLRDLSAQIETDLRNAYLLNDKEMIQFSIWMLRQIERVDSVKSSRSCEQ